MVCGEREVVEKGRGWVERLDGGVGGRIPRCVEAERDLIAMHHDIRDLAIATRRVRHLAAQEDARV